MTTCQRFLFLKTMVLIRKNLITLMAKKIVLSMTLLWTKELKITSSNPLPKAMEASSAFRKYTDSTPRGEYFRHSPPRWGESPVRGSEGAATRRGLHRSHEPRCTSFWIPACLLSRSGCCGAPPSRALRGRIGWRARRAFAI